MTGPWPRARTALGSGCGILIRLGLGDAKEWLPPYCEQQFRGSASADPRVPEAHSDVGRRHVGCALAFALRECVASGLAQNPTSCGLPELFSSTGAHNRVRGSSPSSARGRALAGGDCVRGGAVRSRAGGGPGRRATLVPPREHKERGAWPGRPRGSVPSPGRREVEQKV